ncbi:DNA-binding response regulator [Amycolatopsis sp. PS_44_ISF1]|uniref:DNA-binding response regulator n=1 Tax=Amycolatopsis sp. PS_44_ISF1 TaxID=2974917 RepID=UPI0028DFABB3|nr:DNA-binding response regulator [Amycolatopsis sp. PS_44_ISF1]MDT8909927.1 DNA-binding response regulator [Amycolatopsis sp. PS_44_ISF1]
MTKVDDVVTVRGERELLARVQHLFAAAKEVSCAANDLSTWAATHPTPLRTDHTPGRKARKIYLPRVLLDPASAAHLREITRLGAQVRIAEQEINETILLDQRVAILAAETTPDGRSYTVLSRPDLVNGISSLFEVAWRAATDVAVYDLRYAELRQLTPQLLDLLASGCTDESAARTMNVGLRTYRRRVAELMAALGATSRFQAGARAREAGLL